MLKILFAAFFCLLFFGVAGNAQADTISEKINKITLSGIQINMKRAEARKILKKKGFKKFESGRALNGCLREMFREEKTQIEGRGLTILSYSSDGFVAIIDYTEILPHSDKKFLNFIEGHLGTSKCINPKDVMQGDEYHWGDELNCTDQWFSISNENKRNHPLLIVSRFRTLEYPSLMINQINIDNLKTDGKLYEGVSRFFKSYKCERMYR